jgi:hypothetical protein
LMSHSAVPIVLSSWRVECGFVGVGGSLWRGGIAKTEN